MQKINLNQSQELYLILKTTPTKKLTAFPKGVI